MAEVREVQCCHCSQSWPADDRGGWQDHVAETFHDVELVVHERVDSIAMALDDDAEPYRFDDGGRARLMVTLSPPAPLEYFANLMQVITDTLPPEAVIRTSDRGYEVWSREPSEDDIDRELRGFFGGRR